MELSGWSRPSRGIPAQSTAAAGAHRIRMGSCGGGRAERQGRGTRSGTCRFVPEGSGSDAPEHAHPLHSAAERAHRARSRLRTIPRRILIGRPGQIKAIEELGLEAYSRALISSLDPGTSGSRQPQFSAKPNSKDHEAQEITKALVPYCWVYGHIETMASRRPVEKGEL